MLPAQILDKIPASYELALKEGDLFFYPSTIQKHTESSVEFEIRLCPALQIKPTLPTPHVEEVPTKKQDVFSPPYVPNLFIGYLDSQDEQEAYAVLLNKFSIIPQHFLLVTREPKSQGSPLSPDDLVAVYSLLSAARKKHKNLFAFYNCGDLSGASQAHKHVQFIESTDDDESEGPPIEVLARSVTLEAKDKPFALSALPYANHVYRLPERIWALKPEQLEPLLAQAFLSLLDLAISTIRHDPSYPPGKPSYNVIMTLEHIHLIPRKEECYVMPGSQEKISVNSLGYAGMLLVKSEAEMVAVQKEGVGKILRGVALESVHDILVQGTSDE